MSLVHPDRYFARTSAIDVKADILGCGFTHVLLDVDNTIVSRADHQVPKDVRLWIERLRQQGVRLCFLSNNWHSSVFEIAAELGIPVVAKACKPLPHGFLLALRKVGASRKHTVMVGDQLSTDVVGAHLVGLCAYLVCPLVEEDLKHTMLLRSIERAFISDHEPEGVGACETSRS